MLSNEDFEKLIKEANQLIQELEKKREGSPN